MAEFTGNYVALYSAIGVRQAETPAALTISDGEADTTFELGDTFTIAGNNATYQGTIPINGSDFIVYLLDGSSELRMIGFVPDPTTFSVPAIIDPADIDDSTPFITCFAAGTLIATPDGDHAVETLEIGDLVVTADGRSVPVRWIGRNTVHKAFTPAERFVPVRIRAGALGDGLPHSDLVLTADHALILDGLAICAGALVNDATIAYDPIGSLPDRVTYYHVETDAHDVILAHGAPAETYVDYIRRRVFDNYDEYVALYGDERIIPEMEIPRISAARLVPDKTRARLLSTAAA